MIQTVISDEILIYLFFLFSPNILNVMSSYTRLATLLDNLFYYIIKTQGFGKKKK